MDIVRKLPFDVQLRIEKEYMLELQKEHRQLFQPTLAELKRKVAVNDIYLLFLKYF
jgi:hypothetical protein